jgi:hypothetical protein
MTRDDLIGYIFRGSTHKPSRRLRGLLRDCPRFSAFVELNRDKIRKKIRCAIGKEDLCDVLAELRVACLLLIDGRIILKYETYGSRIRAPDLTAVFMKSVNLNVEVARIRRSQMTTRYAKWCQGLRDTIGIADWDIRLDERQASLELIETLEQSTGQIAQFVRSKIANDGRSLPTDAMSEHPVAGFENKLTLILFPGPLGLRQDCTRYASARSIAYKQDEYLKLRDVVVDKLGQARPGMINVIFVICEDEGFNPPDLDWGMESLFGALSQGDPRFTAKVQKRFRTFEEFKAQFPELSAVVLRSEWREPNVLWQNPLARNSLPLALHQYLSQIDHPFA